ncbi:MAG: SDR family NAD(P)-dependent oxidoreductase [Eubacteriales bacterium]|nr:SDR family NAD(P)-dependent oxidoreductase [Eubacteriales bacterium]
MYEGKTILITGGTGSFGTAFAKHLKDMPPKKLIIFSRDWLKQKNLKDELDEPWVRYFIGDIRDKERLTRAFKDVDIVIHAAAIKDLESCEYNPSEAMQTNVQGTQNVIDACIERKVSKCLFISTDKAVNPINTYGVSKAMAERLWINANKYAADDSIKFSICRYGNVAGSNGSVIPVWKKLIKKGVTELPVTDERMTRFHFLMKDVVSFVDDSLNKMKGGDIFIPRLPSIRIVDLADAFGYPYKIIGIRPGEKIHESMDYDYDSGTNPWFLSVEEIKETLKAIF